MMMFPVMVDMTATGYSDSLEIRQDQRACSTYSDCYILGCCEKPVYEGTHERGI